jgi:predicted neuraminidase
MVMTSADNGRTWREPVRLPDGILGPIKDKPVQLASGEIVSGSSTEQDGWRVHFERSTDGGRTWTATAPVEDTRTSGAIQPTILTHPGGGLQAIGRTRSGRIFETRSSDRGLTWSPLALTDLPNPSAGIDAVTLRDGRQLVVYNHTTTGRSPLNIAVSTDGRVWQAALVLEDDPGLEFSYPAVIQTRDGLVHITYTWHRERIRHVVVDPARLTLRPIVNGEWPR